MFKLSNVDNKVDLELSIEGYQFPEIPKDQWCFVKVIVKQGSDVFEAIDPALQTTELLRVLEWFRCLQERKLPRYARLCFTEPCLEFDFLASTESSVRISVHLSHELKPNFDLEQLGRRSSEWSVVFELRENELKQIVSGVEVVLLRCPVRDQS